MELKTWRDLPTALYPQPGEDPYQWFGRITAYAAANPGVLTPLDAAAMMDVEGRALVALNAKADLVGGIVPTAQIPAIATAQTVTVASQAAMLALTAAQVQPGDIAIRSDQTGRRWLLAEPDPSLLGSWISLEFAGTGEVVSVNGQQGVVVLGKADVGLGSVNNTADLAKPVSTAQQDALGAKAPITDARFPAGANIVDGDVAASAAIAEGKLALASDAAAATPSRRSLGAGAAQALPGNHVSVTNARAPLAHTHQQADVTLGGPNSYTGNRTLALVDRGRVVEIDNVAAPGTFIQDTFTDAAGTLLENHVGETGARHTKHPSSGTAFLEITAQGRIGASGSNAFYLASGVPGGPDYDVAWDVVVAGTAGGDAPRVCVRLDPTANTYYSLQAFTSGNLQMLKVVAGTATGIAFVAGFAPTVGLVPRFEWEIRGTSLRVLVDGVEKIAVTDADITAAGRVGLRSTVAASEPALHVDNLVALNSGATAEAAVVTVPTDAAVAFDVGEQVIIRQMGAGQVSVAGDAVAVRARGGALRLAGQYAEAVLTKRAASEWVLSGDTIV